ncbi:hypothetical protein ACT3UD_18275 [Glutamicibacter sp. 287]|uniref:hypothetical protein n=1 Tax=unclassified Glutamicibacter TaxID=2627139 RepID=UPI0040343EAD
MAGNPVYGKGYHDGSTDTRQQDLLIAGAVVAGVALIKGSMVGYEKLKQMQTARREKRMLIITQDIDGNPKDEKTPEGPIPDSQ